jgi:hypothetical protein
MDMRFPEYQDIPETETFEVTRGERYAILMALDQQREFHESEAAELGSLMFKFGARANVPNELPEDMR